MRKKKKLTAVEQCLVLLWRDKIRALPARKKRDLAAYLDIDYFTLMGKVNGNGGFTKEQRELLKKYTWAWTDGKSQELDGTELDELFKDDEESKE